MTNKKIIDYVEYWALNEPNHWALIDGEQRISYRELYQKSYQYARALIGLGLRPGDRIAHILDCCPEFFYLYLGASMIGIALSGIHSRSPRNEVERLTKLLDAKLFICSRQRRKEMSGIQGRVPWIDISELSDRACAPWGYGEVDGFREKIREDTPVFIVFTSGTTGEPKGAVLSQKSILTSVRAQIREFGWPEGLNLHDVIQHQVPLCHVSGAVQWGVAPLAAGSTMILQERFYAEKIIQDTERLRATILAGVPSMWEMMFRLPNFRQYDLSSVRWCMTGAAPISKTLAERIFDICGKVSNPLGMTETSGFCSMFQGETSLELVADTVGRIIPELEYRILKEAGEKAGTGEIGQLSYKGDSLIPGYLSSDLPKTGEGYFMSGDLAWEDASGRIHLCGRKDDMFTVGGSNVYPEEVERLLLQYPGIGKAVVVPVKHDSMGHVCKAFVVPEEKGQPIRIPQLKEFLENNLIYYKVPREIVITDRLPGNALGKIDRKACRRL